MRRLKAGDKAIIKQRIREARELMVKHADDARREHYARGDFDVPLSEPELPSAQDLLITMRTADALLPWPIGNLVMVELLRHVK